VIGRIFQRLLTGREERVFVVVGEQWQKFEEPAYSTDPKDYDFDPAGCETKSPSEFQPPWDLPPGTRRKRGPAIMKAFRVAADAISFAYCCNLANVVLVAYDRQDGKWVASTDQSDLDHDW
jgi:hypothetical protein